MDGKGVCRDNVFVERLWRSVKYERVYLRAYDSVSHAHTDIAEYFEMYNRDRSHSANNDGGGKLTQDEAYLAGLPKLQEVA